MKIFIRPDALRLVEYFGIISLALGGACFFVAGWVLLIAAIIEQFR